MTCAIIVAAGSSRRMGFDKLFALLGERPVLAHTLSAFQDAPDIDAIVVVASPERVVEISELQHFFRIDKIFRIVHGGRERQDSVFEGIRALPNACEFVAVHDGARPLISQADIRQCAAAARRHAAAACARRITDTLKRADARGFVTGSVDRSNLWCMETPQIFGKELLLRAFSELQRRETVVTDEVSAVELTGHPVALVEAQDANPKITVPRDLTLAYQLLTARNSEPEPL
ncbi:MAG TPA: 2-C-methyl-D-erythritol 4-phosphate cytidylyltransferase [Verrucomicrobiales bacterium]|nr:2-C-methyl-D-erythritol 4-phosphate cytidylyltransferase [Verrucomicrobiales bacterium]